MSEKILTEVRCPSGPQNLLAKVGEQEGVLELSCRDCTRQARKFMDAVGGPSSFRIVHRFDLAGKFIESEQQVL